jgi:iron complex transport system permease protein
VGSGSLAQNSWSGVGYLLPRLLLAAMLAAVLVRPLAVLELDDASARSLGSPSSICAWLVWVSRVRHRLRGERGGADRFYRAGGARHGGCWGQKTGQRLLWAPILGALLLAATDLLLQT